MGEYDVIVIGAGPAGMMAAGRAAELGKQVLLLEKNKELGKKLSITGGGRCNILNAEEDVHKLLSHYGEGGKYLYSSFAQFGMEKTRSFFEERGLPLTVEARKRAFPRSEKASDVVALCKRYLAKSGVEVRTRSEISALIAGERLIEGVVADGATLSARSYILATGGLSHPKTGSTGDGFRWLRDLGFSIKEPTPAIVPLRTQEQWAHRWAGNSIADAKITFGVGSKHAFSIRGSVLFTHFGLSGPSILNVAGKVADLLEEGDVNVLIDIHPDLELGLLDKKICHIFDANKNKLLKNALSGIIPAGTAVSLLSLLADIDPETSVHSVTREERRKISELLKSIKLTVTGLMGLDRAVVADGGVALADIDMRTLATRRYPNLHLVGDMLHIRRPSGGYSLQLAWTSGYVAGCHA